jgi:hypothetical protein
MVPTNTCSNPRAARVSLLQRLLQWIAEGEATRRIDSRMYLRVRSQFNGKISGPGGNIQFRGIDLHHAGIGAKTWRRLEPGTTVFLHLDTFQSMGFAVVRHCTWRGFGGFHVGLEFRSPLMRCDAGNWQYKSVQKAAGSPEDWDELMGKL